MDCRLSLRKASTRSSSHILQLDGFAYWKNRFPNRLEHKLLPQNSRTNRSHPSGPGLVMKSACRLPDPPGLNERRQANTENATSTGQSHRPGRPPPIQKGMTRTRARRGRHTKQAAGAYASCAAHSRPPMTSRDVGGWSPRMDESISVEHADIARPAPSIGDRPPIITR